MVTMLVVGFSSEQILDSSVLSLHKQIHPINVTSSVIALFTLFSISILSFIFFFSLCHLYGDIIESRNIPSQKGPIRITEPNLQPHTGPLKNQAICLRALSRCLLNFDKLCAMTTSLGRLLAAWQPSWWSTFSTLQYILFLPLWTYLPLRNYHNECLTLRKSMTKSSPRFFHPYAHGSNYKIMREKMNQSHSS